MNTKNLAWYEWTWKLHDHASVQTVVKFFRVWIVSVLQYYFLMVMWMSVVVEWIKLHRISGCQNLDQITIIPRPTSTKPGYSDFTKETSKVAYKTSLSLLIIYEISEFFMELLEWCGDCDGIGNHVMIILANLTR